MGDLSLAFDPDGIAANSDAASSALAEADAASGAAASASDLASSALAKAIAASSVAALCIGLFEVDIDGDLRPITSSLPDQYYELDGNSDIMPKGA